MLSNFATETVYVNRDVIFKEHLFPFADLDNTCMEISCSFFSTSRPELVDEEDFGQAQPNTCGGHTQQNDSTSLNEDNSVSLPIEEVQHRVSSPTQAS